MKVDVNRLKQCTEIILKQLGENDENAVLVAENLVKADMRGISTHGTYLLKPIYMRVKNGQLELPTLPDLIMENGSTAVIDGKNGLGMVAAFAATNLTIEKAKGAGIAMVVIRNANNIGHLAFYTEYGASHGMITVMFCNAAPAMAPWGAAEPFIGTNPIALSFPSHNNSPGFTLDMATSVVARGKIRKAARQGINIASDWALDSDGIPTTDPNKALEGTLQPIGGPKGTALAMAIDIITSFLGESPYGPFLKSFHSLEGPTGVGAVCIAVDVSHFIYLSVFKKLLDDYIYSVKNLKKAKGFTEIFMPGELEHLRENESLKNGIEMDSKQIIEINEILKQVGSNINLYIEGE